MDGAWAKAKVALKHVIGRRDVNNPNLSEAFKRGIHDISSNNAHDGFGCRIVEKNNERSIRQLEHSHILADGFNIATLLRLATIAAKVFHGGFIQFGSVFHTDDSCERIVRGHQQNATLAGAEIDKGELFVTNRECGESLTHNCFRAGPIANAMRPIRTIDSQIALVNALGGFYVVGEIEGVSTARAVHGLRVEIFAQQSDGGDERAA